MCDGLQCVFMELGDVCRLENENAIEDDFTTRVIDNIDEEYFTGCKLRFSRRWKESSPALLSC